ncbi:MAG: hypothetical protein AAFV69_13875, partial [Pseudomonadota bacterium]
TAIGTPIIKNAMTIPNRIAISMTLLTFRFLEVAWRVIRGEQELLIASHEAEEMIEAIEADTQKPTKQGS